MKKDRGSITIITLVTILFMLSFLISTYMIISNRRQAQTEIKRETQEIYESDTENIDAIYNSYFAGEGEVIPIYTEEQLLKIGTDEYIVGGDKIYTCTANANYILMTNLQLNVSEYIDENPNSFETVNSSTRWINIEKQKENGTLIGDFDYNGKDIMEVDSRNVSLLHAGYNEEELLLYYDGINNTSNGHSNSSTTWEDVSGNDNDGTLTSFTTTGWKGTGLRFDGTSSYINTALIPSQELGGSITISTNLTMDDTNNYRGVWGFHEGNITGIVLQCEDGRLDAAYGNGADWQRCYYTSANNLINAQTTITVVYRQGQDTTIYINGQKAISSNTTGNIIHGGQFWLGKGYEAPERYFKGVINNLLVYNRALSDSEILEIYQIDYNRF